MTEKHQDSPAARSAKIIAMYFPQLHAIPENDAWWGQGFTDWVNVKKARPQFEGHYQPRVPLGGDYYDQSRPEVLHRQIDLARRYGLYGFCHYHYWFDGKQLLETPTELMLADPSMDFPFCLSWANETWSRRWDGLNFQLLIKQTHPPERARWKLHFDYLVRAWSDERAITVDGKPVFVIYRPQLIPELESMLDYWREQAHRAGLKGLYFIAQKSFEYPRRCLESGFDAVFQFQPFETIHSPAVSGRSNHYSLLGKVLHALPERVQDYVRAVRARTLQKLEYHEYDTVWEYASRVRSEPGLVTYPGAFADWDNTARYGDRARIFRGASPERFEYWFSRLLDSMPERGLPEDFIWVNAWNEWAEGAYLEPDERHGFGYLEAIQRQLQRRNPPQPAVGED
jgi:hypothetical protein